MRYRLCSCSDLLACQGILDRGFSAGPEVQRNLPLIWSTLMRSGAASISLTEDPELPAAHGIESFSSTVFVRDDFAAEFCAEPVPNLAAVIYERIRAGCSPVLTLQQVREANSRQGLSLVVLHFALRNPDLGLARTQQVLGVAHAGFFFFHAGFKLNLILREVYGPQHAEYMRAGGFVQHCDFRAQFACDLGRCPAEHHPFLFRLGRDDIKLGALSVMSLLFQAPTPRFYFTYAEQRLLQRALLGSTDRELSTELGISLDAVKQTWCSIYNRIFFVAPRLIPSRGGERLHSTRGLEKRRHVIEYLRNHAEELRPFNRPDKDALLTRNIFS